MSMQLYHSIMKVVAPIYQRSVAKELNKMGRYRNTSCAMCCWVGGRPPSPMGRPLSVLSLRTRSGIGFVVYSNDVLFRYPSKWNCPLFVMRRVWLAGGFGWLVGWLVVAAFTPSPGFVGRDNVNVPTKPPCSLCLFRLLPF